MAEGDTGLKEEDLEAIKLPKTYLGGGLSPKQLDAILQQTVRTGPTSQPQKQGNLPAQTGNQCPLCKDPGHYLVNCQRFLSLDHRNKQTVVTQGRVCIHCLEAAHRVRTCKSDMKRLCRVNGCVRYHHPLLHPTDSSTFYDNQRHYESSNCL